MITFELKVLLGDEYDLDIGYVSILRSVHLHMCNELESIGREASTAALERWYHIEKCDVTSLQKQRHYMDPFLIELAQAFLSIHASFAWCEHLFGDAGHGEGHRRQHVRDSVSEIVLMIRSCTLSYI